jgi:hypothetical protein
MVLPRQFVGPLGAVRNAPLRARVQPVHAFLEFGDRERVLAAGERPLLEIAEPVEHDGDQRFVGDPIDADFVDRAVLEVERVVATDAALKVDT